MKKNIEDNKFNYKNTNSVKGAVMMEANMYDFNFKMHSHEEFLIGVTKKGIQTFYCKGEIHKVQPGGIMTFNPDDAHDGHAELKSGLNYEMFYIDQKTIDRFTRGICGEKSANFHFKETVQYDDKLTRKVLDLFNTVSDNENNTLESQDKFFDIISSVMIRFGDFSKEKMDAIKDNVLINRAKNYIRQNATDNISLNDIAAEVGVSPFYFARMFKKTTGLSPHNFLNQCRISIIKDNITEDISFAELALQAGFYDQSHMNKRFKETMGLTPKQYKELLI